MRARGTNVPFMRRLPFASTSHVLITNLSTADGAQLEVSPGELETTLIARNVMAGVPMPHVSFGNGCGERQRPPFPNVIVHAEQKLDCEARPAARLVSVTLEILSHQPGVSFINLAQQFLRLLLEQPVRCAGRRRWLKARVIFQPLYAF